MGHRRDRVDSTARPRLVQAVEVTAARAKRRLIAWARYALRHPTAGPRSFVYYRGHMKAYHAATTGRQGRRRRVWEPDRPWDIGW